MTRSSLQLPDRKTVWAVTVFLLFCFYLFWPINFYLAETLKKTYYMLAVPILVGGVLYFRRLRDGLACKFLSAYWLWFWFSRVLNGAPALQFDFQLVFDLALMLPCFCLGLALEADERRRFLDWFSAVIGGFFFLVGLVCLTGFIQRKIYLNPITEGCIGGLHDNTGFLRLNVLDTNPNISGCWYMMALFLMVYEFFACRKKLWRIPILLAALLDFCVIAVTYSRSAKLTVALSPALLAAALLRRVCRRLARPLRGLLLFGLFALTLLSVYKASDYTADGLSRLSYALYPAAPVSETAQPAAARVFDAPLYQAHALVRADTFEDDSLVELATRSDPRSWTGSLNSISSGRVRIWQSAFQVIRLNPSVLWRGTLSKDTMTISNTLAPSSSPLGNANFHNFLLQVLMMTGLPGLLLVLALMAVTVRPYVRLLFSDAVRGTYTLALPALTIPFYFLLEAGLFTSCDIRTLFYFILCGMALGYARDLE